MTPWTACLAPLSMGILQARILEWLAMPSSRGSSLPRDQMQVSHIAGGFFTIWATREVPHNRYTIDMNEYAIDMIEWVSTSVNEWSMFSYRLCGLLIRARSLFLNFKIMRIKLTLPTSQVVQEQNHKEAEYVEIFWNCEMLYKCDVLLLLLS